MLVRGGVPLYVTLFAEHLAEKGLDGVQPGQIVLVQFESFMLDQSVFGARLTDAGARAALNARLGQQIAELDIACGLTAGQKQKLELAGRGDIVHFFWRLDEFRRKPHKFQVRADRAAEPELMEWADHAAGNIQRLQSDYQGAVFAAGSLFARIRTTALTVTQGAHFEVVDDIRQLGGKITARPREHGAGILTEVRLSATRIDNQVLQRLAHVKALDSLLLDDTSIGDAALAHLKDMKGLENLDLRKTRITDAGLEVLAGLTNLRSLRLEGTKVTDAGLVHLKALTHLEYLHLGNTSITGGGLVHLLALTELHELYLGDTRVDDEALAHLRGLAALEHLSLSDTDVTSAGLPSLKGLSRLQRLFLIGTDVTAASAAELKQALPKLTIIR